MISGSMNANNSLLKWSKMFTVSLKNLQRNLLSVENSIFRVSLSLCRCGEGSAHYLSYPWPCIIFLKLLILESWTEFKSKRHSSAFTCPIQFISHFEITILLYYLHWFLFLIVLSIITVCSFQISEKFQISDFRLLHIATQFFTQQ